MHDSICNAILTMVSNDPMASAAEKKIIEEVCTGKGLPVKRKKLILRKEVLNILGVSAPTLRQYIKKNLLKEIRLSCRKIRFDYDEVVSFAENGGA